MPVAASSAGQPSLMELMSFGGAAPETNNGRLAMLGFVAALFAELASGESVVKQLADEPTGIALAFILFSAATLIPLTRGQTGEAEAFGPFTAAAEKLNGRAAMIGFAALLIVEGVRGAARF